MGILLEVTTPIFVLIGAGYLVLKLRYFTPSTVQGIMKFVQNIALPVMLFNAVSQMDLGMGFNFNLLLSFYLGSLCCFVLALVLTYKAFKKAWEESVVVAFTALFGNTVLLGLAVVGRAFGEASLTGSYTIVAFHAPFCFLVGITTMEASRKAGNLNGKVLFSVFNEMGKNAIVLGMLTGFAFNLLNVSLPNFIQMPVDMLSGAAIPAALFGLGGILAQYKPEGDFKVVLMVCIVTLVVHPALTWILSNQLFALSKPLVQSAVLTSAMPPGLNAFIFASMYERGRRIAASAALIGTVASIFTASLAIYIVS